MTSKQLTGIIRALEVLVEKDTDKETLLEILKALKDE